MDEILTARDVKRTYSIGKTRLDVLKGVTMEVNAGETVSIMGTMDTIRRRLGLAYDNDSP